MARAGNPHKWALVLLSLLASGVSILEAQRRKPSDEPLLVTEPVPPVVEPPATVKANIERLTFYVAPYSTQGPLSRQLDATLRYLLQEQRRSRVVKLRAFVTGGADSRRVEDIVTELFQKRKLPLPALSVVEVGPLPAFGAQLVLEAVLESRRVVNPHGLAFAASPLIQSTQPTLQVAGLVDRAAASIEGKLREVGLDGTDVLAVTCFCSSLEDAHVTGQLLARRFPHAARNYVQLRRDYTPGSALCEAVARLRHPLAPSHPSSKTEPPTSDAPQLAVVPPGEVVFSGMELGFQLDESNIHQALRRLTRSLAANGVGPFLPVKLNFYAVYEGLLKQFQKVTAQFYGGQPSPVITMAEFEGLPALDATFGIEAVAVAGKGP